MKSNVFFQQKIQDHILSFKLKTEHFFFSNDIIDSTFTLHYNKLIKDFYLSFNELNSILTQNNLYVILDVLKEVKTTNIMKKKITKMYLETKILEVQIKYLELIIDYIEIEKKKHIHINVSDFLKATFIIYFENIALQTIQYKTKMLEKKEEFCLQFENDDLYINLLKYTTIISVFFETIKKKEEVFLEDSVSTKKELILNILELHSILDEKSIIENFNLILEYKKQVEIAMNKDENEFKKIEYKIIFEYCEEILMILNRKKTQNSLEIDVISFLKKMLKISKFS